MTTAAIDALGDSEEARAVTGERTEPRGRSGRGRSAREIAHPEGFPRWRRLAIGDFRPPAWPWLNSS